MKRCLACAGLVLGLLGGAFGDVMPRAEAQAIVAPGASNTLTPQQQQKVRRMMRARRHLRHRHRIPVAAGATVIAPNRAP